ncbi:metal-sensing transcriptional repressor [Chelatococcus sp. SYSU_G07232]|uniref:Metal-sensing transcriptional repressor n=1 Tax=Chelatococcus albus TaxID=3047466 RepID=A0ABT7ACX6_9HYPH|nr:metal-sensing transcriptional repressor [Chelatococcus sp. SYSU_G07232]MDJ1157236.1 metal-sensing transcriptional repressor [Chelatococcus sp. SYSU_G07232]
MSHADYPGIVARLKRAEGHLRSVIAMIEEGRDCVALSQQLHAVESAVANAKRELIHHHIEHWLDDAAGGGEARTRLADLRALAKYL